MRKFLKTYWPFLLCLLLWALGIYLCYHFSSSAHRKELEQLRYDLAHAQRFTPLERTTIHDTVEVIRHETVVVEKIKPALTPEEKNLIKDIGTKLNHIESLQTTAIENHATVQLNIDTVATPRDGFLTRDSSVLHYSDHWARFAYNPSTRQLDYFVRDSLRTVVSRRFKHHFLWWRWGLKGYEVQILNFNPNATITYDHYIHAKP